MELFFTKKKVISFLLALLLLMSSVLPTAQAAQELASSNEVEETEVNEVPEASEEISQAPVEESTEEMSETSSIEETNQDLPEEETKAPLEETSENEETKKSDPSKDEKDLEIAPVEEKEKVKASEPWMTGYEDKILEVNSHVGSNASSQHNISWTQINNHPATITVYYKMGSFQGIVNGFDNKAIEGKFNGKTYTYSCSVRNLSAEMTYFYTISNGKDTVEGQFTTARDASSKEMVRFAMLADTQVRGADTAEATGAIFQQLSEHAAIIL